jgi:hypothetical protein
MDKLNLNDLLSDKARTKYSGAKRLIALSREDPAELYPHLDFFVKLLDSENKIIRWTAIDVVGALAAVDREGEIDKLLGRIIGFLDTGNMITANHAISALTDIAMAKPEHRRKITDELLKVEYYDYETDECRNIAIGKVILALGKLPRNPEDEETTLRFVGRQTTNTRNATAKKAAQFLRKTNRTKKELPVSR